MYRVTVTQEVLQSPDLLCEIPGERYSILKDGKSVAVLLPSNEANDVWIMTPIYTEDWNFAMQFVTILTHNTDAEQLIQPTRWSWLKNLLPK